MFIVSYVVLTRIDGTFPKFLTHTQSKYPHSFEGDDDYGKLIGLTSLSIHYYSLGLFY